MVTLYTTHCPQCNVLTQKLDAAGIEYNVCEDIDVMTEKGFMSAPVLEVNDQILNFKAAVDWIKSMEVTAN